MYKLVSLIKASRLIRQSLSRGNSTRLYSTLKSKSKNFDFSSKYWITSAALVSTGLFFSLYGDNIIQLDSQLDPEKEVNGATAEEVQNHNSVNKGIWVVINGEVLDLSEFFASHPGGPDIIKQYAGKNASKIFNKFHSKDTVDKMLPPEDRLGPLIGELEEAPDITMVGDEEARQERVANKPPLSKIFNISDFEHVAKQILPLNAWAYYSGAADDEVTLRENHYAYARIFFNPRVLVDVSEVDISTEFLGAKSSAPFYCSGAAQAKLGQEEGELSIARGCGKEGIIQMISNAASYPLLEIIDAAQPEQTQWFQLYVTEDRKNAFDTIKYCEDRDIKGIFVTVDTPQLGRREKDMKIRFSSDEDEDEDELVGSLTQDYGKQDPIYYKDASLTWNDIDEFKKHTKVPIVLKGVQRVQDVLLAVEHGVDAVVLSNHGGRQLEYSKAPVEVLSEVMPILKQKKLDDKIEIYVDGGIRRGTDILKALCLGAKGVGLGRPFLYANSTHGENGVRRAIQLLKDELVLDMKLLGAKNLSELSPELLDLRNLHARGIQHDMLYDTAYDPLSPPKFKNESI